jgi:hypothetical protein
MYLALKRLRIPNCSLYQGCQIFLAKTYQKRENIPNYYKIYQKRKILPDGNQIDQMVIKYTNIFHCKTLQNLPKLVFLV